MPDTAANYRMLHTMIRVHDLDKSLAFYTDPLGMKLLRKRDVPERQVHAGLRRLRRREGALRRRAHLQLGPEKPYELGTGFGHLAVGVPDVYGICERGRQGRRQGHARARAR